MPAAKAEPSATPEASPAPSAAAAATPQEDSERPEDLAERIRRDVAERKGHGEDFGAQIEKDVSAKIVAAGGEKPFREEVSRNFQSRLSWVALAMLPLFALLLRTIYWRSDSFYFAHLIFSLHYHSFLLVFWTLFTGLDVLVRSTFMLRWLSPFTGLCAFVVPGIYLYLALRRVYGGGKKLTVAKVIVIGAIHLLALVIGVGAVGAMAVFSTSR